MDEKKLNKTVRSLAWKDWFWLTVCQFLGHSRKSRYRFTLSYELGIECWNCPRCGDQFNVDVPPKIDVTPEMNHAN